MKFQPSYLLAVWTATLTSPAFAAPSSLSIVLHEHGYTDKHPFHHFDATCVAKNGQCFLFSEEEEEMCCANLFCLHQGEGLSGICVSESDAGVIETEIEIELHDGGASHKGRQQLRGVARGRRQ